MRFWQMGIVDVDDDDDDSKVTDDDKGLAFGKT